MIYSSLLRKTVILLASVFSATALFAQTSSREVISINDGWRFQKGDPAGTTPTLLYDIRPVVTDNKDDKVADSMPTEAEKLAASNQLVLKPWILPSGNAFTKDPGKRHLRPATEPAITVPCASAGFDDSAWQRVNLPHDWAIAGPFTLPGEPGVGGGMGRLPSPGIGWYRKQLDIPASDAGKSIFLDIDGAMSYAMVWLNGRLIGGWPYGYASWRLDLTPYITPGGKNQLAIRLDNPSDSWRWYPGGGIYRNVWLVKTQPVHIGQWGTFVTTPKVSKQSATVELAVTVDNDSKTAASVSIDTQIYALDAQGKRTGKAVANIQNQNVYVAAGASATVNGSAVVANPRLWGPPPQQVPHRYIAVTTVSQAGKTIDTYETRFGIREVRFDGATGVHVNGERIVLQGVNQHHDLGALGAAFNVRAAERQLEILREMGCNAIRLAHNPPAFELLELTDRMGFLVVDEIGDMWYRKKTPLDAHLIFADWHEQDLRAFMRRDRNSPSVIMWSVGNEVGEQYTAEDGAAVAQSLRTIAFEEDPTRPSTASMNFAKPDSAFAAVFDVISLNYQGEGIRDAPAYAGLKGIRTSPLYPAFHEKFPSRLIFSSESASALSTRGTYLFPVTKEISAPVRDGAGGDSKSQQVSAYELHTSDFGSSADKVFTSLDQHPFVAGEFVWSGWDYLGEPTPYYTARSSYSGIIDLAGFKKDRFYLYQARWRPELPMAHILPHWSWPERVGQVTPVHVFTSGDEVELFLNGKSLGRKQRAQFAYRLRWDDVVYEPGTLKAVAYKNGKHWATDEVKTAGTPAKLEIQPDRKTIIADGLDLSFVTVRVIDKDGVTVPRADNRVTFSIEGPGEIVATDNGDPADLVAFPSHTRAAFSGYCLVIIRGKPGQAGKIKVTATADGVQTASTTLSTKRP